MSGYVPKVGDRVRATLGETVLVGSVIGIHKLGSVDVRIEGSASPAHLRAIDDWQFEQVVEVPTKFGAVVRNKAGRLFTLADLTSISDDPWVELLEVGRALRYDWASTATATEGGFTVLFEGVDE